jgi:type VI protein secretion system component VasK
MVMDYLFPVVYIDATISHVGGWPWWDGPVSILMGSFILLFTGVFVSEFIHDGIVISGLKREKKLIEKTEQEIKEEDSEIKNLEDRLSEMQNSLKRIEKHLKK